MALPDDYKNMTLEELENYIEGFLSAKYGEEVRDNFARIAYILGQHVESTGADATSAETAKNTAVTKAQEAAESEIVRKQHSRRPIASPSAKPILHRFLLERTGRFPISPEANMMLWKK